MKSLLMLFSIQKYKTIIDILRNKKSSSQLTTDEHNLLILTAVMINLEFDYITELESSTISDIVPDLNIFKSFIYNKAKEQNLIPQDSTFKGYDETVKSFETPTIRQIDDMKYDLDILKLYAKNADSKFISYFNKGKLESDIYELNYIYNYNLIYSINTNDYNQGNQSITYFSTLFDNYGDIISSDIKHTIANFLSIFPSSISASDESIYTKILNITVDTYHDILKGDLRIKSDNSNIMQKLKNKGVK